MTGVITHSWVRRRFAGSWRTVRRWERVCLRAVRRWESWSGCGFSRIVGRGCWRGHAGMCSPSCRIIAHCLNRMLCCCARPTCWRHSSGHHTHRQSWRGSSPHTQEEAAKSWAQGRAQGGQEETGSTTCKCVALLQWLFRWARW